MVEEEEQAEVASDADGFDRSDVRDRDGEGKGEGKTGEEGSRMEVLQAELVSIQASISQLDENIARMKEARGWLIRNPSSKKKLPNNAHASLWRSILSSGGLPGVVYSQQDLDHTGYHGKKGVGGRGGRPGGPARGLKRGREPGGYQLQSLNSAGRLGKRARQPSAKERRLESFWGQCGTILNAIKKHRCIPPAVHFISFAKECCFHRLCKRTLDAVNCLFVICFLTIHFEYAYAQYSTLYKRVSCVAHLTYSTLTSNGKSTGTLGLSWSPWTQ